jgi:hypothetical protein
MSDAAARRIQQAARCLASPVLPVGGIQVWKLSSVIGRRSCTQSIRMQDQFVLAESFAALFDPPPSYDAFHRAAARAKKRT